MKAFLKELLPAFVLSFAVSYAAGLIYGLVYINLKCTMPTYAAFAIGVMAGMGVLYGAYKITMKVIACRN